MSAEIVTYHYVRDQDESVAPRVHGITRASFESHLEFASAGDGVGDLTSLVTDLESGRPQRPGYIFTFDDGLRDHLDVAAALSSRDLTGTFFVTVDAVLGRKFLDVHMINFILGWGVPAAHLTRRIVEHLDAEGIDVPVEEWPESGRFDPVEVRRLKGLLQRGLEDDLRHALVDWLFEDVVGAEPATVAESVYLDLDELRSMAAAGMEIGGHGASHAHMTDLSDSDLETEMDASMELMKAIHRGRTFVPVFCYPHGSYDQRVAAAAARAGFRAAVTTRPGTVSPDGAIFELPRIDARDLDEIVTGAARR